MKYHGGCWKNFVSLRVVGKEGGKSSGMSFFSSSPPFFSFFSSSLSFSKQRVNPGYLDNCIQGGNNLIII